MIQVILETQHGCRELEGHPAESVAEVLRRSGIPLSAVWTYTREGDGSVAFLPSSTRLRDLTVNAHARANRNIDILGLSCLAPMRRSNRANATTEWTFPGVGGGTWDRTEACLSQEDCVGIVQEAVDRTLDQWPVDVPRRLVVGTSGGGDSNVLLTALIRSERIGRESILPAIVLGPNMSAHLRRAQCLCDELGCNLDVIEGHRAASLAGIRSVDTFFGTFERHYPDADIDFPWTWLLRRTLAAAAREHGSPAVAIGANREDLISEGFLRLARGLAPMPAPYRRVGEEIFVYPMCQVPKKIGDGAYPERSLENYEQRTPSISAGRSVFYQLAHLLGDYLPGMDVTLLTGFSHLGARAAADQDPIGYDERIGDYVAQDMVTDEQSARWARFLDEVRIRR